MTIVSPGNRDRKLASLFHDQSRIVVMGVVNVTPDSFSDGGQFLSADKAVDHALKLIDEGADIIDIGGESTRPGAERVENAEQLRRVIPVISRLASESTVPLSIDTSIAVVARAALSAGASIVNDISGLTDDSEMAKTVADYDAGLVLMHKRGEPGTMQLDTRYESLVDEITQFLSDAADRAVRAGVDPGKIMIDPGIGFGKDLAGNVEILKSIGSFVRLGYPVLIGASRKSFVGQITGADAANRLYGSLAAAVVAVINGATAVRVHDVKETRQAVDIAVRLR
jgi:dihydropteroate synthase